MRNCTLGSFELNISQYLTIHLVVDAILDVFLILLSPALMSVTNVTTVLILNTVRAPFRTAVIIIFLVYYKSAFL